MGSSPPKLCGYSDPRVQSVRRLFLKNGGKIHKNLSADFEGNDFRTGIFNKEEMGIYFKMLHILALDR